MASPVPDSYSTATGGSIYGGRSETLGALTTAIDGMSAGQWLNWTSSTNVQPITDTSCSDSVPYAWLESLGNYPMTNWPGKMTFDADRKQIVITGCAQGLISEVPAGTHSVSVYFDVTTGTFSKTWNPMGVSLGHVYDANCSIPMGGKVYRIPYNSSTIFQCDLSSRVWSSARSISALTPGIVIGADVFPEMGASGSVLMLDGPKLCRWDIATDALSTIGTYDGMGSYTSIHYCAGYVVFGGGTGGTKFRKINSAGTVTEICASLAVGMTGTGSGLDSPVVPDPLGRGKSWVFQTAGNAFSLDHASGAWTDHGAASSTSPPCAIQGHGAFVFFIGSGRANSSTSNSQVWIYKAP